MENMSKFEKAVHETKSVKELETIQKNLLEEIEDPEEKKEFMYKTYRIMFSLYMRRYKEKCQKSKDE